MRFVIEIPDQLAPAAASGDTGAAGPVTDTFSGGPAEAATDSAAPRPAANSGGEAEELAGGIAIARATDEPIDGGAAPNGN
jgi:hypothetical protein